MILCAKNVYCIPPLPFLASETETLLFLGFTDTPAAALVSRHLIPLRQLPRSPTGPESIAPDVIKGRFTEDGRGFPSGVREDYIRYTLCDGRCTACGGEGAVLHFAWPLCTHCVGIFDLHCSTSIRGTFASSYPDGVMPVVHMVYFFCSRSARISHDWLLRKNWPFRFHHARTLSIIESKNVAAKFKQYLADHHDLHVDVAYQRYLDDKKVRDTRVARARLIESMSKRLRVILEPIVQLRAQSDIHLGAELEPVWRGKIPFHKSEHGGLVLVSPYEAITRHFGEVPMSEGDKEELLDMVLAQLFNPFLGN